MSKLRAYPMTLFYLALILIQTHFSISNGVSVLDLNSLKINEIGRMEQRVCSQKKIGDCLSELEMDSEINRRVLAMQKRYISYETLKRDMVPCARAGAPYYNCHVGPANPYSRGCEVITGCRGTIHDINT
ncbi:Rapid alkalinization factor [Trema orientale]|uniref:Rapid alkalinization factor n=1 Tax=Trema orientale TaxID=63057 RepID=A0A2P5FCG4_TREOI|nr:Rapid alkalinization factor [Trema orientale]